MVMLSPFLKMILIPFSYSCDLWGKEEKWEGDNWGAQAERQRKGARCRSLNSQCWLGHEWNKHTPWNWARGLNARRSLDKSKRGSISYVRKLCRVGPFLPTSSLCPKHQRSFKGRRGRGNSMKEQITPLPTPKPGLFWDRKRWRIEKAPQGTVWKLEETWKLWALLGMSLKGREGRVHRQWLKEETERK